jgi:DNA (cytosine-5)-methyltransferase 1
MLRHLDLFSGIAGFALAARMAGGIETAAFCELDPFCREVIARHFGGVPIFEDVHDVSGDSLRRAGIERVDLVTFGIPCQPHSSATRGRRRGIYDDRWLWPEVRRIVADIRPAWALCENVAGFDGVALETVCVDLETLGYQVQTLEIPACAVDADHIRARLWVLGYTDRNGKPGSAEHAEVARMPGRRDDAGGVGAPYGLSRRMDPTRRRMSAIGNAVHVGVVAEILRAIVGAEVCNG